MLISKHVHSCLLIEEAGKTVLVDPGVYTWQEKALDVSSLQNLEFVLITHEHQDHMYIPLIHDLVSKFPSVKIITTDSAVKILAENKFKAQTEGEEGIEVAVVPHEAVLGSAAPNVLFNIFGRLTHPGDSHSFDKTQEILALPVQAPWGSMVDALHLAEKLKPKFVIPIHDWHWNATARANLYETCAKYLEPKGIKFINLLTSNPVEL